MAPVVHLLALTHAARWRAFADEQNHVSADLSPAVVLSSKFRKYTDQVQRCERHNSNLHQLDKDAMVSLTKGWWQTGERTKIKAQQSHDI